MSPVKNFGGKLSLISESLAILLNDDFGGVQKFINAFNKKIQEVQGSGYGWLSYNKNTRKLEIETTKNQDTLIGNNKNLFPLLVIDIWEHAFYIQYQYKKKDYLTNIWNVVNWKMVSDRLSSALN